MLQQLIFVLVLFCATSALHRDSLHYFDSMSDPTTSSYLVDGKLLDELGQSQLVEDSKLHLKICTKKRAIRSINFLQKKLEYYLRNCKFTLAHEMTSPLFSFSTIDYTCNVTSPCLVQGNFEQFTQRFYDFQAQNLVCNQRSEFLMPSLPDLRYYNNGTILVDRMTVIVSQVDPSKISAYLYTFYWNPVGYCKYQLSYLHGNNALFPTFMYQLQPCGPCQDPVLEGIKRIQTIIGNCNRQDFNLIFLNYIAFLQIGYWFRFKEKDNNYFRECPAIPDSCCVTLESEKAVAFFDLVCGADTHSFGDPVRVSPTEVDSQVAIGPTGGPYTIYDIAYIFTENPLTLRQIILAPQHCFGLPKPAPCSECLDSAIYQVYKLQNQTLACDNNVLSRPIVTVQCGTCPLSPNLPCSNMEASIVPYFNLVCVNASSATFGAPRPWGQPIGNKESIAVTLTISSDIIDIVYELVQDGNTGVYSIVKVNIADWCDVFNVNDCTRCPS